MFVLSLCILFVSHLFTFIICSSFLFSFAILFSRLFLSCIFYYLFFSLYILFILFRHYNFSLLCLPYSSLSLLSLFLSLPFMFFSIIFSIFTFYFLPPFPFPLLSPLSRLHLDHTRHRHTCNSNGTSALEQVILALLWHRGAVKLTGYADGGTVTGYVVPLKIDSADNTLQ